jgi:hypothetical protein
MFTYALYCAAVQSSVNLGDLRSLPAAAWDAHSDRLILHVDDGDEPVGLAWERYPHCAPLLPLVVQRARIAERVLFRLEYEHAGCRFLVDAASGRVDAYGRDADPALLQRLLTGPVAGFLMRLRGRLALHASVCAIDGAAVAFVADAGLGKTTTAAECARRGWRTIADDVLLLTHHASCWMAHPGPRSRHMWPETLQAFAEDAQHPIVHPGTEKKYVDRGRFGSESFADAPQSLRALIFLEEFDADADAVRLEPLTPIDALGRVLRNRYGLIDTPPEMRAAEATLSQRLIADVHCARAIRPPRSDAFRLLVDAVEHSIRP